MKKRFITRLALLLALSLLTLGITAQNMDDMWGGTANKKGIENTKRGQLFRDGNYAMFIHWGIYSEIANKWKGKTYYGIGEWLMSKDMADIPAEEYVGASKNFNPVNFNAKEIAQLAKDAGMKYVIVTSKHHDGFAMYNSKASDFNIVKASPFARDPMKELSEACKEIGLGFGFYYSHNQDWTTPYGTNLPKKFKGDAATFDNYFKYKCLPQVEEITTQYGDIELVWFDTPGNMQKEYIQQLVDVVRKNQPNAYVSGRAGHGLGDYSTLGDMEIPVENVDDQVWESVDVTNDSWGYAWYDNNWKSPKEILKRLISTVARGGTYMLNIGPMGDGTVPAQATKALKSAGEWIHQHPQVVYGTDSSPWKHALPWGDVTVKDNKLYLSIYEWNNSGKLYLPGLKSDIKSAKILTDNGAKDISYKRENGWTILDLPYEIPNKLIPVIEIEVNGAIEVNNTLSLDPIVPTILPTEFAQISDCDRSKRGWMEKFGEWKHQTQVDKWNESSKVTWTIDIQKADYYLIELNYSGEGRLVWKVENSDGIMLQNQQNSTALYNYYPIGWMRFSKTGKHTITVSLVEGEQSKASLAGLKISPITF